MEFNGVMQTISKAFMNKNKSADVFFVCKQLFTFPSIYSKLKVLAVSNIPGMYLKYCTWSIGKMLIVSLTITSIGVISNIDILCI